MGRADAPHRLVVFEDPQCPYCRQFEKACGELLRSQWEAGTLAVEFRMRCFLGVESVRANNALALAAEDHRFDELRRALFSAQPPEGTGGFTTSDLRSLGRRAGLTSDSFALWRRRRPLPLVGPGRGEILCRPGSRWHPCRLARRPTSRSRRTERPGIPGCSPHLRSENEVVRPEPDQIRVIPACSASSTVSSAEGSASRRSSGMGAPLLMEKP